MPTTTLPPRALPKRLAISVLLSPSELHELIKALEAKAARAIEQGEVDFADWQLCRVAELREASR